MKEKDLGITEVRGAKANIPDLNVYGDGDAFALLCKASSQEQGWMKSTKVCNVPNGCVVQVTTQQKNPDGSYAVAEALTFVPGVHLDKEKYPRTLKEICRAAASGIASSNDSAALNKQDILTMAHIGVIDAYEAKKLLGVDKLLSE